MNADPNLKDEQKKEREAYRTVLQTWYSCIKNAILYAPDHPSVKQASLNFINVLQGIFRHKIELNIQHPDGLFLVENEYMIEESLSMYDIMRLLETLKIARVAFFPGVTEADVVQFLLYLIRRKQDGTAAGPAAAFTNNHVRIFLETPGGELTLTQKKGERILRVNTVYEEWLKRLEEIFSKLIDEQNIPLFDVAQGLDPILDIMSRDPASFSFILSTHPVDNLHVHHSLNTMVLSIYLAQQMDLEVTMVKAIAVSALFHDVGRLLLPADFTTGYRLSPGDADLIHLHCRDGASFLAGVPGLPMTVVRTALEHHIGFDGQGYPRLPSGRAPHFFSQVVGLADFLSWGTVSDRYYHRPVTLHRLIRTMMHRSGTQFDPLLVKLVLPFFGLYPPGTKLRLSSGEQAVALESNLRNITRPSVGIRKAGQPGQFLWLGEVTPSAEKPFVADVFRPLGRDPDVATLYELIPNLVTTQKIDE